MSDSPAYSYLVYLSIERDQDIRPEVIADQVHMDEIGITFKMNGEDVAFFYNKQVAGYVRDREVSRD